VVFELFDLFLRVGFDFFPFLEFALLRLGREVVLNLFWFRTVLGRLVVDVDLLLLDDFDPIDRNLDFFNAGFGVTESLPKVDWLFCVVAWKLFGPLFELDSFDVTETWPKLDLLFCEVAWKLFGPLFELNGFLKPNFCPLGWLLLVGLLLLAVLL